MQHNFRWSLARHALAFGYARFIRRQEVVEGLLGIDATLGHPDLMQVGLRFRLQSLRRVTYSLGRPLNGYLLNLSPVAKSFLGSL